SYVVHVTNADGLTDTDTVTVIVLPRPKVNAGADIEACQGEQVELSAQGDGELFWFQLDRVDESAIIGPVVSPDTTTTFVVVIVDISGCRGFDQVTVFITKPPMVNAGMNRVLIEQFEFRMEATLEPGESGTWHLESGSGTFDDPHAPDTRVTGLEFGDNIFSWTVTNEICPEAIGRVGIRVKERQIPTVITPNGDGKNDHFLVAGILRFPGSELVVLNRWGEEVYRASPYENNWDGVNHEGRELPEGTYYIILKLTEDDIRKRSVMIIR
ncbi:MAG: gliding motility-associated C-terminal domain-containing protein, partial [Bacteroidales bacterium]|nr:gliding motility-associated C-terminal domain-containing protein [Bacteroidales bacterium]